jgi:photosystem II stability/assembly factor-like uncharacterized protein
LAGAQTHVHFLIHMTGPAEGWAFRVPLERGGKELLHTADGGLHWANVTPPTSSGRDVFEPAVLTSRIAWVELCGSLKVVGTGAVNSCELLHTVDGGRNWKNLGGSLPSPDGNLAFIDAHHGWLMIATPAAGSENTWIHRTTDGGRTWVEVASATYRSQAAGLPFGGDKSDIAFLTSITGWVTGYSIGCNRGTYLYVTQNGGQTWRQQKLPVPAQVAAHRNESTTAPTFFSPREGVLPVSISYSVKDEYCEGGRNVVLFYATHDGGVTWRYTTPVMLQSGNRRPPASFADMNHGWVTQGDVLYRTTNGGFGWTSIPLPTAFANIEHLDFISPRVGWATRETAPFLLKTVDGGQTWAPLLFTISRP